MMAQVKVVFFSSLDEPVLTSYLQKILLEIIVAYHFPRCPWSQRYGHLLVQQGCSGSTSVLWTETAPDHTQQKLQHNTLYVDDWQSFLAHRAHGKNWKKKKVISFKENILFVLFMAIFTNFIMITYICT